MSIPKFRLARVRRVREIQEEIARSELLAVEQTLRAAERAVDAAATRHIEAIASIERLQRAPRIDPVAVLVADTTVKAFARRLREERGRLALAQAAEHRARSIWLEERKRARTLARLEQHHDERRRAESEQREVRELEEIALRRAARDANASQVDAGELDR